MEKKQIKQILENNELCKINVIMILLETKAYRFVVFKQMFKIRHKSKRKEWDILNQDDKITWIKEIFIPYYETDYLINHLIRAIKQLGISKNYKLYFECALMELKQIESE